MHVFNTTNYTEKIFLALPKPSNALNQMSKLVATKLQLTEPNRMEQSTRANVSRDREIEIAQEKEISMCIFDLIVIIEPEPPFREMPERAQRTHSHTSLIITLAAAIEYT